MPSFGCLLLVPCLLIMLGWAIGACLLWRDGHVLIAVALFAAWPLGLNVVLGANLWIGSKLQRDPRAKRP